MSLKKLKSMTRLPFHPFIVHTSSGESYMVSHPELYWLDPDGDVLLVKDETRDVVLIDIASITECVRPAKVKK